MKLAIGVLVAGAALLFTANDCWAHGGQYRGGGGEIPPGLREPEDPTPATPPPADSPTTPPSAPPVGGPTTPPASPAPETPPPATDAPTGPNVGPEKRAPKKASTGFETWNFWYHYNNSNIENLKKSLYTRVSSQNPLFQIGGGDTANRSDSTHATDALVRTDIIETLKWAMNKKNVKHSDARSAAYIAGGKIATKPEHIELLKKGLDPKEDVIVQQSAALGYGVLRRADADRQFSSTELSKVRDLLFDVFARDKDYDTRTRSFAILSIGLLGDQPFIGTKTDGR